MVGASLSSEVFKLMMVDWKTYRIEGHGQLSDLGDKNAG
jgi:hypothetical protein